MSILKFFYHIYRNILDTSKAFLFSIIHYKNIKALCCDVYDEIFVTHTFGGGTKTFEKNYLKNKNNYLIIRNVRGFKTCFFTVELPYKNKKYYISDKNLYSFIRQTNFRELTVSSIIPFTNWNTVLSNFLQIKQDKEIFIRYMIHDFHCICPNFTLVPEDIFCEIKCTKTDCNCSKKSRVNEWRKEWGKFLKNIDEIRVFNNSSADIIQTVYPDIKKDKILCVPHDMSYCNYKPIKIDSNEKQRVAIVGACNTIAKGSKVVNEIIKKITNKEFLLVGDIPVNKKFQNVISVGKYKQEELPFILEKYNVATVIFPSVWPETFSYVISELILLDVNIVCFNFGAQADKVKKYKKGFVCESVCMNELYRLLRSI